MVKVGLVNLWGRSVFSISSEKRDWDICYKALLISSPPEANGVTGTQEWGTVTRWEIGPLCLSLSCFSRLFFLGGGETFLSLWGVCSHSPQRWIVLLSLFLILSSSTRLSPREWLGAKLRPLRWWSFSFLQRSNSLSLSTTLCNTTTCSLSLSTSTSLIECEGLSLLVANCSPCGRELGGCGASLWTFDLMCLSTWMDSTETLGRSRWDGPLQDRFAIESKPTFEPTA